MVKRSFPTAQIIMFLFSAALAFLPAATFADASVTEMQIPVPGQVTMIDLGAKKCIPCKMMTPILEELQNEYKGRAAIVFVDVWQHPDTGRQFGIKSIPTQIFFDVMGQEVFRHEGFFDKASITAEFEKLGIK